MPNLEIQVQLFTTGRVCGLAAKSQHPDSDKSGHSVQQNNTESVLIFLVSLMSRDIFRAKRESKVLS